MAAAGSREGAARAGRSKMGPVAGRFKNAVALRWRAFGREALSRWRAATRATDRPIAPKPLRLQNRTWIPTGKPPISCAAGIGPKATWSASRRSMTIFAMAWPQKMPNQESEAQWPESATRS